MNELKFLQNNARLVVIDTVWGHMGERSYFYGRRYFR